jgi:hypothetical protein
LFLISVISHQLMHRSARLSSISLEIGIMRVLSKHLFFIQAKKPPTNQLFEFPRFLHHTFFDHSSSFNCRNLCLGALRQQQQFFSIFFGFDDLKLNYSKCVFLKNLKKLPTDNKYIMYVCCNVNVCLTKLF